jgi:hypothetical protein
VRRNLVIVRAGDTSLHPRWLEEGNRNWDLLVNYFGDDPVLYRRDDVIRLDSKGPKWPALQLLIQAQRDLVSRYDYIWLPDDDIDCQTRDINRLFDLCARYGLWLAQPALTPRSYISWGITVRCPLARLRWTNFCEIMVPCFQRDFLLRCLPTMSETLSGWGLDFVWPHLAGPNLRRVAIVDAVAVTHTRPVGSANYGFLRERGITASEEYRRLLDAYHIDDETVRVESLAIWGGSEIEGKSRRATILLGLGYAYTIARAYAERNPRRWMLDGRLRSAITAPAEFPMRRGATA